MIFLQEELEGYLGPRFPDASALTALGSTQEGTVAGKETRDRLILTLVNIEREGIAANTGQTHHATEAGARRAPQSLNLNLVFMIAANFPDNYKVSLAVLSQAVAFFQANPVFAQGRHPRLPEGIERLRLQWQDLDLQAIHNVWSALGGKYMPSVVYKAGMLTLADPLAGADVRIITGTDVEG